MTAKRKQIDWEAVEREYRAGQLSIREIARRNKCSEGAIRKKAKAEGWERDLSAEVRKAVREKLVRKSVRNPDADRESIVDEMSDRGADVVMLQRSDIKNLRELEQKLIAEINGEPTKLYITQYQGQIVEKVVGLTASERAAAAANLAQVQHKRIALERQAFNLDDEDAGTARIMVELD